MQPRTFGDYEIHEELGKGAFGRVYRAVSQRTRSEFALKLEPRSSRHPSLLPREADALLALQGGVGIPVLETTGKHKDSHFLVMQLLGSSLYDKFKEVGRLLPMKAVLEILLQAISRVEFIHSRFYLHRDVKPQNFLLGTGANESLLYIADFGLAKKYQSNAKGSHVSYREEKAFVGTSMFASLNTHLGIQQSRRDDMESLLYMTAYLIQGRLPWSEKSTDKSAKHSTARLLKASLSPEALFKGCSVWLARLMTYVKTLQFEEKPEYEWMRKMVTNAAKDEGEALTGDLGLGKCSSDLIRSWESTRTRKRHTRISHAKTQKSAPKFNSKTFYLSGELLPPPLISSSGSAEETFYLLSGEQTVRTNTGPSIDRNKLKNL